MIVERLELVDFRNYAAATFELTGGTTVVVGDNGQGKTNFAEALAYLATLGSFRGAPPDALVRAGATSAVVRAELRDEDGRASLIEAELVPAGRNRVQVNRQRLQRARDLLGVVRVTVFSPDDLVAGQGWPGRAAALPRRHARRAGGQVRRRAAGARSHRAPAQHAAAPGRLVVSTSRRPRRSTCGTPGSLPPATSSGTPGPRSSPG